MHFAHVIFRQIINIIGDFKFLASTQNQINAVNCRQFFRFQLRITPNRRHKRLSIQFHCLFHHLFKLLIRVIGDRTRVYYINICNIFKFHAIKTFLRKIPSNSRRFRKIQFASKRIKSDFFPFHNNYLGVPFGRALRCNLLLSSTSLI